MPLPETCGCNSLSLANLSTDSMKVKLKRDFYEWKAGVEYPAEPAFFDGKQGVKVFLPGYAIVLDVSWDDIESAE